MNPADMPVTVTHWSADDQPIGEARTYTWTELYKELQACSLQPHDGRGWAPARFSGNRRAKRNLEQIFCLTFDVDTGAVPFDAIAQIVRGLAAVITTTKKSTAASPRWRVILLLCRPTGDAEYTSMWRVFERRFAEAGIVVDHGTKDSSRLWYLPSLAADGAGVFAVLDGAALDVDAVLAEDESGDAAEFENAFDPPEGYRENGIADAVCSNGVGSVFNGGERHYCEAALAHAAQALRSTPRGVRNTTLTKEAYSIGGLIGPGRLTFDEAHDALNDAIGGWDPNYIDEHRSTLVRQLDAGSAKPRNIAQVAHAGPSDGSQASRNCTDLGNQERLVDQHGPDLRCCADHGRMAWDGRIWQRDKTGEWTRRAASTVRTIYAEAEREDDPDRRKAIATWARQSESAARIEAMQTLAECAREVAITADQLDRDPFLLNVQNGTVDLRTGTLRAHDRGDLITRIAGASYDEHARCPVFEAFLEGIFESNADLIAFVRRFIGYSLTGDVREQVLLFCFGTGANGKSTFIDLMIALMGGSSGYAMPAAPGLLLAKKNDQHPTELADLRGARLVTCVEIGDGKRLDEERVKALTGGDAIKARYMREDFFTFAPSHKLILAANHRPEVRGVDPAIWRRILELPFRVQFSGDQKDPALPAKLRAELDGVLRWAVEGALEWQRVGLCPPAVVTDATKTYRAEQDVIGRFLDESCVMNAQLKAGATELYTAFTRWAEQAGEHPVSQRRFGAYLGAERGLTSSRLTGGRAGWSGVGLLAAGARPWSEGSEGSEPTSRMTPRNPSHEAVIRDQGSQGSLPSLRVRGGAS